MNFEDWHTHTAFCRHAVGDIEDYIKRAIELDFNVIGIGDHFPYEIYKDEFPIIEQIPYQEYAMNLSEVDIYLSTLEKLKKKYEDDIIIRIGFEIDYFSNLESSLNLHLNKYIDRLDYILGSVHIIKGNTGIFAFDDSRFLAKYQDYESIDDIYLEYYGTIYKMINSDDFTLDILSHFDLPKKFNKRPLNKESIFNDVAKILEEVKKKDLSIEINTSGLRREVKEQYPAKEIIEQIKMLEIPILLGSDAHHPEEVGYKFRPIIAMLREMGFTQLCHFEKRERSFIEI